MATFPWQVAFDEDREKRDYVQGERETECRCQVGMREWIMKSKETMIAHEGIVFGGNGGEKKKETKKERYHQTMLGSSNQGGRLKE